MSAARTSPMRWPAEWEPHDATWLAWPHNSGDWRGKFAPIPWAFAEIVRHLAKGERIHLLVQSVEHRRKATDILTRAHADLDAVSFLVHPMNRGWMRDCGPIVVEQHGRPHARLFAFTGWAKYPNYALDATAGAACAEELGLSHDRVRFHGEDVVLEGGAIDGNGCGTILATEECLLDDRVQPRNPGLAKLNYEQIFEDAFGATHVIWLGPGIVGDDTHGHVDDLCRFVNPTTVVLVQESDAKDANYALLKENRERLQDARLPDGSKIEVIDLPMPDPLMFDGVRLPASYANFYIANAAVLVPTFNDRHDRLALGILADAFPDRPVVGIHAVDLVWGFGTLHCLTQQVPRIPVASPS